MKGLSLELFSALIVFLPCVAQAEVLSFGSASEVVETFACDDSVAEQLAEELDYKLLLAPACAKHTTTVLGIKVEYCDGGCTNPQLTCQPTLNANGTIRRCSCKPVAPGRDAGSSIGVD